MGIWIICMPSGRKLSSVILAESFEIRAVAWIAYDKGNSVLHALKITETTDVFQKFP